MLHQKHYNQRSQPLESVVEVPFGMRIEESLIDQNGFNRIRRRGRIKFGVLDDADGSLEVSIGVEVQVADTLSVACIEL